VRFAVAAPGDAPGVVARAKQALSRVDEHSSVWPSDDEWRMLLPPGFVARCVPELTTEESEGWLSRWRAISPSEQEESEEKEPWSLVEWLYWAQPERREWFWWDANTLDDRSAVVAVEVQGWPFPWGSLSWLLRAAGGGRG
jgi:hypothetical protein